MRLLLSHPFRAADALQLASALVWCREQTAGAGFVSLDNRLRAAATREGFACCRAQREPAPADAAMLGTSTHGAGFARPAVEAARAGRGRLAMVLALAEEADRLQQEDRLRVESYERASAEYLPAVAGLDHGDLACPMGAVGYASRGALLPGAER